MESKFKKDTSLITIIEKLKKVGMTEILKVYNTKEHVIIKWR